MLGTNNTKPVLIRPGSGSPGAAIPRMGPSAHGPTADAGVPTTFLASRPCCAGSPRFSLQSPRGESLVVEYRRVADGRRLSGHKMPLRFPRPSTSLQRLHPNLDHRRGSGRPLQDLLATRHRMPTKAPKVPNKRTRARSTHPPTHPRLRCH